MSLYDGSYSEGELFVWPNTAADLQENLPVSYCAGYEAPSREAVYTDQTAALVLRHL